MSTSTLEVSVNYPVVTSRHTPLSLKEVWDDLGEKLAHEEESLSSIGFRLLAQTLTIRPAASMGGNSIFLEVSFKAVKR